MEKRRRRIRILGVHSDEAVMNGDRMEWEKYQKSKKERKSKHDEKI